MSRESAAVWSVHDSSSWFLIVQAVLLATKGTQVVEASREGESNMSQPLTRGSTQKPSFLTVEELAEMLRVEVRTVYSWVSKGSVPFRKAGRRTVFLLDEIMEWTEEQSLRR